jgi:hypothetical protein
VKNHVAQAKNHEAPENPDLRRKVLLGQIKSEVLVTMSGIFFLKKKIDRTVRLITAHEN